MSPTPATWIELRRLAFAAMKTNDLSAEREPAPAPDEAEIAVYSLLFTAKPTREERRMAVRLLLRKASKTLGRSA